MSEEKFIVHIHDCDMTIGEAIRLLNRIDYDNEQPFEPRCAWRFNNDKHSVTADTSKCKGVRFDIYKEEE